MLKALLAALCAGLLVIFPFSAMGMRAHAHAAAAGAPVIGIAAWAGDASYFNVRAAPRSSAPVVTVLHVGDHVTVLGSVLGTAVDGVDLWYHVVAGHHIAYVLSTAIGYVRPDGLWTGVASSNAESGTTTIYSLTAPRPDAAVQGAFAPGTRMTVLGSVHGTALEAGNDVWYRVDTGSYLPVYIYSAYLKFEHPGRGPVPLPVLTAVAALAVDLDSWRPLYSENATVPRPPASLVKMMTAAVALDHLNPDTRITVPAGAPTVGAEVGGTAMGLLPGEQLPLHDLLWGMLLPSGNDAAYTIAQAVGGTQSGFAALMNAKAAALGLKNTHFVQGYGFDAPGQYSTAWDLASLARYDLAHYPLFARIVATAYHQIGPGPGHPAFSLRNTNKLLGVYPGTFGVKTGTTAQAGQNLVAAVRRNGHRVLVVILGASDRYADATALLNYATAIDR